MADDDACSLCGREGGSMQIVVLDTGEHTLLCSECQGATGDDILVPDLDDAESVL